MVDACIQTTKLHFKKMCNILLNEHCKFMWFTHWFNHSRNNSLRLPHFHSHFIVFTFILVFFSISIMNFKLWQCSTSNDQGNRSNYNSHIWINWVWRMPFSRTKQKENDVDKVYTASSILNRNSSNSSPRHCSVFSKSWLN